MDEKRYIERLSQFCVGSVRSNFPKRMEDQDALMLSVGAELPKLHEFSEATVNKAIKRWLAEVGTNFDMDHVSIRRRMVDLGYLIRSIDCKSYSRTDRLKNVPDSRTIVWRARAEYEAKRESARLRYSETDGNGA